jgi:hypothetical protein
MFQTSKLLKDAFQKSPKTWNFTQGSTTLYYIIVKYR